MRAVKEGIEWRKVWHGNGGRRLKVGNRVKSVTGLVAFILFIIASDSGRVSCWVRLS
jgi:hypothetical protein